MEDILLKIIIGLLTVLTAIIGWNVRIHRNDHEKLKEDHATHKLNVSENYAKKSDLNEMRRESIESLKRVYDKIESVDENLGNKMAGMPEKIVRLMSGRK